MSKSTYNYNGMERFSPSDESDVSSSNSKFVSVIVVELSFMHNYGRKKFTMFFNLSL